MNRCLDAFAMADMNTRTVFDATDRMLPLVAVMMLRFIDENERLSVDLNAGCGYNVV
jgi:hypothetical protein